MASMYSNDMMSDVHIYFCTKTCSRSLFISQPSAAEAETASERRYAAVRKGNVYAAVLKERKPYFQVLDSESCSDTSGL